MTQCHCNWFWLMMDDIFHWRDDMLGWSEHPVMQLELLPVIPISEQEKKEPETLMGIAFEPWSQKCYCH